MTEQEYNELMAKTKRELLAIAEREATQHGIRGCNASDSKFEIVTALYIWQTRETKYGKVAVK